MESTPPPPDSVLVALRADVQRLHQKFDRYVIGEPGTSAGLIDRVTRLEERHNSVRTVLALLAVAFVAACFFFVPMPGHRQAG